METRTDKLRKEIQEKIEIQLDKVNKAKKAHEILSVVDWFDQEIFDYAQKVCTKLQQGKYFGTNDELDKYYEEVVK